MRCQSLLDAVGSPHEVLQAEGLQQVIDSIDLETLDGIFGIGSSEDHQWWGRKGLDEVHAVEVGHVDVAENDIHRVVLQEPVCL